MEKSKLIIASIIMGIIVTLVTGLANSTPSQLVGASWYGYPVTWIRKLVLAPQYNPWKVDPAGLISDIIFWSVVILILFILEEKIRKPNAKSTARKSAKK